MPNIVVIGAAQGAPCFGPAYEMARIMGADLRKRRISWICNAKIDRLGVDKLEITEHDDGDGPHHPRSAGRQGSDP